MNALNTPNPHFYGGLRLAYADIRPTTTVPTGLTFTDPATNGELRFTITNAASYAATDEIIIYNNAGGGVLGCIKIADYNTIGYGTITRLTNGQLYTMYAKATSDLNTYSAASATATGTPTTSGAAAPSAPTGVTVKPVDTDQMRIYCDFCPGAKTINFYKSASLAGPYVLIPGASGLATSRYLDTGLLAATQYFYKMSGTNETGEGALSGPAYNYTFGQHDKAADLLIALRDKFAGYAPLVTLGITAAKIRIMNYWPLTQLEQADFPCIELFPAGDSGLDYNDQRNLETDQAVDVYIHEYREMALDAKEMVTARIEGTAITEGIGKLAALVRAATFELWDDMQTAVPCAGFLGVNPGYQKALFYNIENRNLNSAALKFTFKVLTPDTVI